MFLVIRQPDYPLRLYVKQLIYYREYTADCDFEMLLPDTSSQLIIPLDENKRYTHYLNGEVATDCIFKHSWITGVHSRPIIYTAEKQAASVCIQFEHAGLHALIGLPACEFQNKSIDTLDVLGTEILELQEQLLTLSCEEKIIKKIFDFLAHKLKHKSYSARLSGHVVKSMCDHSMTLDEVSQNTGYSKKYLIAKVKIEIGTTPKKYQMIHRFNKAIRMLENNQHASFTALALHCHYYDQAHFVNDFKKMTLRSPGQYLKIKKDYPHVLPMYK